jgi:beta-1,2-mannosidase
MKKYTLFIVALLLCATSFGQVITTHFKKPKQNPILKADSSFTFLCPVKKEVVKWQRADVFNPAAIVKDNKIFVLYRCEDNPAAHLGGRTSRIGLAESSDGIHFKKHPTPVLYPDNDACIKYDKGGGCEDPRIVQTEDGLYVIAYTAWNYEFARLSIAFSKDLVHWDKKGPAFAKAHDGKFLNGWSKSGSMLTKFVNGKQVLAKIKGKYWMYWGENGVNLAWSENLYDWFPLLDDKGGLKLLILPRKNKFDSHLTECGPPAIWTDKGISLFYNGKNAETDEEADPKLPKKTYSVGQVVFDAQDLETVISRSENPFLIPTLPHEKTGQYQAGTTFAEGLVYFKRKWFLYYGTADSFVGLAIGK